MHLFVRAHVRRPVILASAVIITAFFLAVGVGPARPAHAAGVGQYSAPAWFPLRGSWVIGCTWNNGCAGGYHGYAALDIAQNPSGSIAGDPVYAAGAGLATIYSTGSSCGGAGTVANAIQIDHGNNIKSYYYHLSGFAIGGPTWVDENSVVGYVGHTGNVDPCSFNHLHFEVRNNGVRVDPGPLKACHGAQLLTYPAGIAGGPADWNLVPLWSAVQNDGTACGSAAGPGNYQPFAADFNGDHQADIGLRNVNDGMFFIKHGNDFGDQISYPWAGSTNYQPFAADFNGDGFADIGLRNVTDGTFFIRHGPSFGDQISYPWAAG